MKLLPSIRIQYTIYHAPATTLRNAFLKVRFNSSALHTTAISATCPIVRNGVSFTLCKWTAHEDSTKEWHHNPQENFFKTAIGRADL
jgi:hypothetical protein